MSKLVVVGSSKLEGEIKVQGSKNAVLPILAATIISGKISVIEGCPKITDVDMTIEILKHLGCEVKREENKITIDSSNIKESYIPDNLMHRMRSSVIFLGAIAQRCRKVQITYPGGCELGLRPIDLHIKAFKQMGMDIEESHGYINCIAENIKSADIHLDFPSVGATENIMLLAAGVAGRTTITNAAKEPEIEDLQNFLNSMGAKISGAGSGKVVIDGVNEFKSTTYTVMPDRIVASTYMAAAAITGGTLELTNVNYDHITSVISILKETGALICKTKRDSLIISAPNKLKAVNIIRTTPYPGFPTDSQAILCSVLTIADGVSIINENIFDSRFRHAEELNRMGADIIVNGKTAVIKGVKRLSGAKVEAYDLRAGAALLLAGFRADGETEIDSAEFIDRGYEEVVDNFNSIGANIKRVE